MLLLMLVSVNSNAYDVSFIRGFGSYHTAPIQLEKLNGINPAVGLEVNDFQAVYMNKNSWEKNSAYVTYSPDYKVNDYIDLSLQVGFATGYKCGTKFNGLTIVTCTKSGFIPMGAATVSYAPTGKGLTFSLSANPAVAMLSVKYDFN